MIVDHLDLQADGTKLHDDIFTQEKPKADLTKAFQRRNSTSTITSLRILQSERKFVTELDKGAEVEVYAKLPRAFFIPTPVGNYSPDWAIAFKEGSVQPRVFHRRDKGSLSSLDLRKIEECKIECARKFFAKITSDQVKYDVVDSYSKLMQLVQ